MGIIAGAVPEPSTPFLLILGGILLAWLRNRVVHPCHPRSTTNLLSGSWQTDGVFTTEASPNVIFAVSGGDIGFWRTRRETGEGL
jgi:hypothetical protein